MSMAYKQMMYFCKVLVYTKQSSTTDKPKINNKNQNIIPIHLSIIKNYDRGRKKERNFSKSRKQVA
jgi:hypothetical protein